MKIASHFLLPLACALGCVACGVSPSPPPAAGQPDAEQPPGEATPGTGPGAQVPSQAEAAPQGVEQADLTNLQVGDGAISSQPARGSVWACATAFGGGGAAAGGDWLHADGTFDLTAKPTVDGAVTWPGQFAVSLQGSVRLISGNGLPNHPTGEYPVSPADDAYAYDRNPNSISAREFRVELPAMPQVAAAPSCLPMGAIGVMLTGGAFFNALDAPGRDAVAHEIQDSCQGHPETSGQYHYHSLTACVEGGTQRHALVGYAFDGFGLFSPYGEDGSLITNQDLDECHGHTHVVQWDGQSLEMYHYHATWEYPYTLGCFRGTSAIQTGGQAVPGGAPGAPPTVGPGGPPLNRPPGGPQRGPGLVPPNG